MGAERQLRANARRAAAAAAVVCLAGSALVAQPSTLAVRIRGIVARMPRGESDVNARVARTLAGAWVQQSVSADGSIVLYRPALDLRSKSAGVAPPLLGLAESWEIAHRMVREGASFAEPDIEADVPQGEPLLPLNVCPPCPPELVGKYRRGKKPIQRALSDPEWSLNANDGANVLGAWTLLTDAPAQAGAGVVIAHPDTGYTLHPEFYSAVASDRNVLPEEGWDYLDGQADPRDELLAGLFRNPSHGTKTGSVIVSRRGSQFVPGAPRWVSGVAPAAHLIPLRVAEGVALGPDDVGRLRISSIRLAQAIFDAAAGRRPSGVVARKADVISISLGGLPSATLRAAVDYAAARNVIVVAAAGNQVRQVVFPGGYDSVMGVAASNIDSRPWKGSSRGSRVKITAPGESVWTAATRPQVRCLQASDGTSFATATMAGIAAVWLSYHRQRGTAGFANSEPGAIPAAFHAAVRSGFRTVSGWDTRHYGPGIVDAHAVLKATQSAVSPQETAGVAYCLSRDADAGVDALAAILGDRTLDAERVRRLLGVTDPCAAEVASEVATLYLLDDGVAASVDALAGNAAPGAQEYRRVRNTLLESPLSSTARQRLNSANAR